MPKYIRFAFINQSDSGKTKIWEVMTVDGQTVLGSVKWFGRWRKYSFAPASDTVFEEQCLRDIADFCQEQTALKRKEKSPLGG